MTVSSDSADDLDHLEVALLGGEVGVERQVGHADDAVHRRANLVAHVGEELALGAVGGFAAASARVLFDRSGLAAPGWYRRGPRWLPVTSVSVRAAEILLSTA